MIAIENLITPTYNEWKASIMGVRNSYDSWSKYDSQEINDPDEPAFLMGDNDYKLLSKLASLESSHKKFMRMLPVYMDITAPLYWWKEYDTYKVGTVANSCSTMHRITAKPFDRSDFSTDHIRQNGLADMAMDSVIQILNVLRDHYISEQDPVAKKEIWYEIIQLLPESYNQKRTVFVSYESLANMYRDRVNHKLMEWRQFCSYIFNRLPYSEFITNNVEPEV